MGKASSPRCFKAECSPDLGTGRSALFGDYYLSCARASLRQVVVSSGCPSARSSACSHWVPLRVTPSSNLLSSPPASIRRADYFRPPRSAQTPAECFLSVRFAPDFLMFRSSIFVRSASSCALADSVRPALVPRSTRTVSAAAPAFASLTTSKRCARPHSTRGDPLPPETTTCPALVPRSGQVVVSSGRPSARPSACSHWVPLRVAPSSNLLSGPPSSVRRADYFRPPRSAQTPAECFLSVRFAPVFRVASLQCLLSLRIVLRSG